MTAKKPKKSLTAITALTLSLGHTCSLAARARVSLAPNANPVVTRRLEVHTIKDAGLQFEVPPGWNLKVEENGQVVVLFEDGAASLTFIVDDKYQDVVATLKTGLKEKLAAMKSDGEAKDGTHNGMVHISESGSGQMKGTKMMWSIDVLKAGKTVTMLTFGTESALQTHIDEYLKFVDSIKKT